jgi:hypothetical protein
MPWWMHGVALILWFILIVAVYVMAIVSPLATLASIVMLRYAPEGLKAFGEPVVSTWQQVRFVLWPAMLTLVCVPSAIILRRWMRTSGGQTLPKVQ